MTTIFAFVQAQRKTIIVLLMLVGIFLAGNIWSERDWQKEWADHDSVESSQEANAQTATRWIEQRRIIARDEAVRDAQARATKSAITAAGLSATVSQLRTKVAKLATRIGAARYTSDLATSVRNRTAGADAAVFADMLGNIAIETERYAGIADERCTAGMTCEHIYGSVRESNNNPTASR